MEIRQIVALIRNYKPINGKVVTYLLLAEARSRFLL